MFKRVDLSPLVTDLSLEMGLSEKLCKLPW
jgi:hypothetical protein